MSASDHAADFERAWRDIAVWPPALATGWIIFGGDWTRIAEALDEGRAMTSDGLELAFSGAFWRDCDGAVSPEAPSELQRRLKLRSGHVGRVLAFGLRDGKGSMVEIDPVELADLDWAEAPDRRHGAVLERQSVPCFTNVQIGAASLMAAFPPVGDSAAKVPIGDKLTATGWYRDQDGRRLAEESLRLEGRDRSEAKIEARAAEIWNAANPDKPIKPATLQKARQRERTKRKAVKVRAGLVD